MQLDVVLVAEGARASGAALSTPRYEPSWFFDEIDDALVDACMRPRRREQVSGETREWLYRHLLACGHEANAKGHHFMAHAWFECAYLTKDDLSAFISSVNMRMRLGQATLASRLYERLLQRTLTDAHREVVERKLKEATGAKTSRSHAPRTAGIPQDELAQLLDPARAAQEVEGEERERLLKLLRRRGHACNEERQLHPPLPNSTLRIFYGHTTFATTICTTNTNYLSLIHNTPTLRPTPEHTYPPTEYTFHHLHLTDPLNTHPHTCYPHFT